MNLQRKLTATTCSVKHEGTNRNGNAFTLYEVAVVDEAGEPVMEQFKSFDMLPIGQLVNYEIEREDHEKYGVSYLLRLPPGVQAGRKPDVVGMVNELTQRVARLESAAGVAAPTSPALATSDVPTDDDSIPF